MRVALLSNLFPTDRAASGGIFVRHRIDAAREIGVSVSPYALDVHPPEWVRKVRKGATLAAGSDFIPVNVKATGLDSVRVARGTGYPSRTVKRAVTEVLEVLDLASYDVLVAHGMYGVPAGAVARGVAAAHGKPFVVVLHGSDVNAVMPRIREPYAEVLNAADGVVFVSAALEAAARDLGYTGGLTRVVSNGVNLDTFDWRRREVGRRSLGIEDHARVVAYVGNLTHVKGADRLPALASELRSRDPELTFLVVGDGPGLDGLRQETNLTLLGRLSPEGVADVMAAADALVMPSRSEGWPCVIFESLASGTPVVATSVGGVPEALAGGGGRTVPEGSDLPRAMATATLEVMDVATPPQELRRLADGHDWTSTARAEGEFFQEVLESCQ